MSETCHLQLPTHLDVLFADELKTQLCVAVDKAQIVELDGSAVEHVGAACIQLIVAASRTLDGSNRRLILAAPSECLSEALGDLGLHHELQKWSDSDA